MEKIYNKLVRDKIPEIIESDNWTPITRVLDDEEFKLELERKLQEECTECIETKNREDRLKELADVLEIISSLAKLDGYTLVDVIKESGLKRDARGGFDKKIYLIKETKEGDSKR
jgi:predicted house-cleaning noncanonical NTP pyrophosphatase (MazG superfamily)